MKENILPDQVIPQHKCWKCGKVFGDGRNGTVSFGGYRQTDDVFEGSYQGEIYRYKPFPPLCGECF